MRGRFAYRPKYAVLKFPPPEAASRRRSSGGAGEGGAEAAAPPPPPTLTLLKSRGKNETQKVMSLEVGLVGVCKRLRCGRVVVLHVR